MLQHVSDHLGKQATSCRHVATWFVITVMIGGTGWSPAQDSFKVPALLADAADRERELVAEVLGPELSLEVEANHSKLIRTRRPVLRTSIIAPDIVEVSQFDTTSLEIIGLKPGFTDLSLWFDNPARPNDATVLRYRVRVSPPTDTAQQRQLRYGELEAMINELFPNSSIELILVANKLVLRGQARDAEEAANILSFLRRRAGVGSLGSQASPATTADQVGNNATSVGGNGPTLINLLRVPGEQQVLLKVRIAELSRSAVRELGLDFSFSNKNLAVESALGNAGNLVALLNGDEVALMLRALSSNGYSKVLAEPNLVTLSGR